jgi:hypothetical protein
LMLALLIVVVLALLLVALVAVVETLLRVSCGGLVYPVFM